MPILSADRTLGVINVYLREAHRLNKQEEKFIFSIADALAGLMQCKQAKEALRESETEYRSVAGNAYL